MYTDLLVEGECNSHDKYYLLWYTISQAKQIMLCHINYILIITLEFVVVYILTSSVPTAAYTPILTINHRGSTDREILVAMNYSSQL